MLTHDELVAMAAKKLKQTCSLVVTELACIAGEEPDAIGFNGSMSTLIECKASRADFLSDKKKWFRRHPEQGMGVYRYYMTNPGIIKKGELPSCWGHYVVKGGRVYEKAKGKVFRRDRPREMQLLLSVIRRLGDTEPNGVSVKFYTYETGNRATVGIQKRL